MISENFSVLFNPDSTATAGDMMTTYMRFLQEALTPTWIDLIVAIFTYVCMWFMFEKAGREGWKCLIPFYSEYNEFEITLGNGWKFLWLLCPIVNIVFAIKCLHGWSKHFGKSGWFTVGLIFLSPVFYAILAFDKNCVFQPDVDSTEQQKLLNE